MDKAAAQCLLDTSEVKPFLKIPRYDQLCDSVMSCVSRGALSKAGTKATWEILFSNGRCGEKCN